MNDTEIRGGCNGAVARKDQMHGRGRADRGDGGRAEQARRLVADAGFRRAADGG